MDINLPNVRPDTTTLKVRVRNVHPGDKIKVKIGNKTYTKKIQKYAGFKTYRIKIRKGEKPGTKIKYWIVNKYNQLLVGKYYDRVNPLKR